MYKTMRVSKTEMVNITPSDTYFAIIHNNCEYYQIGPSVRECYKTMNTLSVRRGRPVYNTSDYSFAICPFNARKIMVQFITDDKLYFAESANMLYWAKPQNFAVIMNRQGCAMITGARRYYQTLNEFMDAKIYNPCDFIKTDDTWSNSSYTISVNTKYNKNIQFVKIFNEDKTQILGVSLSKCIMSWYTLKNE
jgi:hypothetical protein